MLRETAGGGNLSGTACPGCGRAGDFGGHGLYGRNIVRKGREERVEVRRVRCRGCRSTHAVIPDGVIPYRAYAVAFVLAVLAAWASGVSNADVRNKFGISEPTRRRLTAGARERVRALLACGTSRAEADAALGAAGVGAVPTTRLAAFGASFAENHRPSALRARAGPST